MRQIDQHSKFKRDYKREKKSDKDIDVLLSVALHKLVSDDPLPERYRDHALSGEWRGFRDCHVKPDLVLIYRKTPDILSLARLGSHSELFG